MSKQQLLLDLQNAPGQGRSDFFPGPSNSQALEAIDSRATWPDQRLLLVGPHGSGRSHLLRIWAQETAAIRLAGTALDIKAMTEAANAPAVCIDDADAAAGDDAAEEILFHIFNGCANTCRPLLLSARSAPATWGIQLPDLLSRLQSCLQVRLQLPDDALLQMVLVKLCDDRQLAVSAEVLRYVQLRIDRSLDTAHRVVTALDKVAIRDQRRVTRALASSVLADLGLKG